MPTYDYACAACGHRFERFESIHDDGVKTCEKCGKKKARRMLGTGVGVIFKGAGFYTTDYKNPSSGGSEGGSSESDSGSEGSDSDSGSGDSDSGSTESTESKKTESKPKKTDKKESKK